MKAISFVSLVSAALALPSLASAQTLDYNQQPNYGTRVLTPGFMPDPMIINVTSGGGIPAANVGNAACRGYVTSAPDFNLRMTNIDSFLRFYVEGGGQDTTLVINDPNGHWYCNDDTFGNDPSIDFQNASAGTYNVWVGSYNAGVRAQARLNVTERMNARPGFAAAQQQPQQQYVQPQQQYAQPQQHYVQPQAQAYGSPNYRQVFGVQQVNPQQVAVPPPPGNGGQLMPGAQPNFGTVVFGQATRVASGGWIDARRLGLPPTCVGSITASPDVNVMVYQPTWARFFVEAPGEDTTLIIQSPDGSFACNDDAFGGINPGLDFSVAQPGVYHVWIGGFRAGVRGSGTFYTSASNMSRPGGAQVMGVMGAATPAQRLHNMLGPIDLDAAPTSGSVTLSPGFMPDPAAYNANGGGSVNSDAVSGVPIACGGWIQANADMTLTMAGATPYLHIGYTPNDDVDTTILVRAPNGAWICNDDEPGNGHNPGVDIQGASAGTYQIWVGTFAHQPRVRSSGTLQFSERQQ